MTVNAVSKIDAPGQRSCDSIGIVWKAPEKASNTSDYHRHRHWNREEISGSTSDPGSPFHPFHCEGTAQQSTDDGLTSKQVEWLGDVPQREHGVFKPVKNPAAQRRPNDGGSDHTEAVRGRKKIPVQSATSTVHIEPDGVGHRLED